MVLLLFITIISLLNVIATHALLTRKRSIKYCIVAFILNTAFFCVALFGVHQFIKNLVVLRYVIYFLAFLTILYIYMVFEESLSKKIFAMFSIWMFSTIIFYISITVINVYTGRVDESYLQYSSYYIIRICLQLLLLPFVYSKVSGIYKRIMRIIPDKIINLMSLYPVIAFLVLINNNEVTFGKHTDLAFVSNVLLLMTLIALGYMLVFAGIASASNVISLRYNYRIIENQVELQRQSYKKLRESMEMLYALKHDIRHHFSALKTMIAEQNYGNALQYIEKFNQSEQIKTIPTLCENFAADSIIKYYMSIASDRNIDFDVDIKIPENLNINPLDLCIVLGNCLDNAIEACDKLQDSQAKQIMLTSNLAGTHIIFRIANNFDGKLTKIDNVIQSSKSEPGHGIGLSSIQETVNRYNGNVDFKYTEDRFETIIIMCFDTKPA